MALVSHIAPQIQGLGPEEIQRAEQRADGAGLERTEDDRALLADAFAADWHNEAYFAKLFRTQHAAGNIMYLALPFDTDPTHDDADELASTLERRVRERGQQILFYDYYMPTGQDAHPRQNLVDEALGSVSLATTDRFLGEDGKSHAHVHHYAAHVSQSGKFEHSSEAVLIGGDELAVSDLDSMWNLYQRGFAALKNHPINGILPKPLFYNTAQNQDMIHAVYFGDDRSVEAFASVSNNLELFDWINPDHFQSEYGELSTHGRIWYGPTIVKNFDRRETEHTPHLVDVLTEEMMKNDDEVSGHVFAVECSDRSAKYAPGQMQGAYDAHPELGTQVRHVGYQIYRAALIG